MSREKPEYVFTLTPKPRKRPSSRYDGLLRRYRLYIEYYTLVRGESPVDAVGGEPIVSFPASYVEALVSYAAQIGGRVAGTRRVILSRGRLHYEAPVVVLPSIIAFRRHLLYALTSSTFRSPARLGSLAGLITSLNPFFLEVLATIALNRYRGENGAGDYWSMRRVGKALRVLYRLD